jgi:methyl-accepting chemotaxis protein
MTVVMTTLASLVVATAAFVTVELVRFRSEMPERVAVLGAMVGLTSSAALLFDDPDTAEEALSALKAESHVLDAVIFDARGDEFARYLKAGLEDLVLPDLRETGHVFEGDHLDVFREVVVDGERIGSILLRADTRRWKERIRQHVMIAVLVMVAAALVSWVAASRLRARISNPLASLVEGSIALSQGNLSTSVAIGSHDEIGTLADAFNGMASSLRELVSQVSEDTRQVRKMATTLEGASESMFTQAERQQAAVDESARSIENMNASVEELNVNVGSLSDTATDTSSSVMQMDSSVAEIARHMDHLSETVEGTASSVVQMTAAIGEISRNAGTLDQATGAAAQALRTLQSSVLQVEQNAQKSNECSERTRVKAERGMDSVQETSIGMREIRVSFGGLEEIVSRLAERSQSIGEVVKVIEGVVTQTNLLALNASIIASHSGEHGRAFAVVAKEVQNLADATASSTREIEEMIQGVQRDMSAAVDAVALGAERVEKGAELSAMAGEALREISEASRESTEMAREIVEAAGNQSGDIAALDASMDDLKAMVAQIARATGEQNSASAEITRGVDATRELAQQVKRSTTEQSKQSRIITNAVEEVATRISQMAEATRGQRRGAEQLMAALGVFREVTQESTQRAEEVRQIVEGLSSRSRALESEIDRFNL